LRDPGVARIAALSAHPWLPSDSASGAQPLGSALTPGYLLRAPSALRQRLRRSASNRSGMVPSRWAPVGFAVPSRGAR